MQSKVRQQLQFETEHGIRDVSGTLPLGHWVEDGTIYCVLEAPDEDACRQHHHTRGLQSDDLHRLEDIKPTRPISGSDRVAIMAAIRNLWPTPVST